MAQTDEQRLAFLNKVHGDRRHKDCDLCFLLDIVHEQHAAIQRILNSEVRITRREP